MIPKFSTFVAFCVIQVSIAQNISNYYCESDHQASTIPNDYIRFSNSFFKYHKRTARFAEAMLSCEAQGAHLAIIKSAEEAQYVGWLISKHEKEMGKEIKYAFVGFHDLYKQGQWTTVLGKSLISTGYLAWAPGQPDNSKNSEHCGSINRDGLLNDLNGNNPHYFICEIECCSYHSKN